MRVLFVKKTSLIIATLFLALISIFALNTDAKTIAAVYFGNKIKKLPIYAVDTDESQLSISFDAAWGADKTREIISICNTYEVKATFFLVGFWIEAYPEMVMEIYNNGFEIGLHSNTHPDMAKLRISEMKLELETNSKLLEDITGVKPTLFRPPFGSYNNQLLELCESMNIKCIQWDVDSLDWKGLSASQIAGRVSSKSRKGSIVLFHNNSDNIIDGLKMVLEYYKLNKMKVIPIGELIYYENYTINNQGTQIKK